MGEIGQMKWMVGRIYSIRSVPDLRVLLMSVCLFVCTKAAVGVCTFENKSRGKLKFMIVGILKPSRSLYFIKREWSQVGTDESALSA